MNNVEYGKDATLGRRFLYENYIECCIQQSIKPVTSGIFGRHVKYLFPERGTRRLGSRWLIFFRPIKFYFKSNVFLQYSKTL